MESFEIKYKRSIKEGAASLAHFGWRITAAKLKCIWEDESLSSVQEKNRAVYAYLFQRFEPLLKQYEDAKEPETTEKPESLPIWVFWWQGDEEMPEIIRLCQQSKVRMAGSHPVILLTKDNIREYLELPAFLWDQFERGKLRIQHLADIIRVCLIERYGGLWMDASIFCHREIPAECFQDPVYSLKGEDDPRFISHNQWTTFLIGGQKGNVLCSFLKEFFFRYCETGKPFIDYFMFDCAIALAYQNIPAVRASIDMIPVSEGDCYWLNTVLDKPADPQRLRELEEEKAVFYKIAWNQPWDLGRPDSLFRFLRKQNGMGF